MNARVFSLLVILFAAFGCGATNGTGSNEPQPGTEPDAKKKQNADKVRAALPSGSGASVHDVKYDVPEDVVVVTFLNATDESVAKCVPALAEMDVPVLLNLNGDKAITKAAVQALGPMKNLYGLHLERTAITASDLPEVAKLTQLRELYLSLTKVRDEDLAPLSQLKNLTTLTLYTEDSNVTDDALAHLSGLKELRRLDGNLSVGSTVGMNHLKGLSKLEDLWVFANDSLTAEGIASLKQMVGVKRLNVEYKGTSPGALLDAIASLPKLESLRIEKMNCEPKEYARLAPLSKTLRKFGYIFNSPDIVQYLTPLTELYDIQLGNTELNDDLMTHLGKFKKLRTFLVVGASRVTDAGVASFADLVELQELNLNGSKVTDAGVKHLTKLQNLKELNLYNSAITDKSAEVLAGLPKLKRLILGGTATLSPGALAKIKGANKELNISE